MVSRPLKVTLMVLAGVVAILVGVVALSLPRASIETSEDGTHTIRLAMLSVPIAETVPLVETPDQYLSVQHAEPVFDTSDFGQNLSFVQDTSDLPALDPDEVFRAVYLGHDVYGEPYYIWQSGSSEFRQTIGQILADMGSFGRLETSYGTEDVGPPIWERGQHAARIAEEGIVTGSIQSTSNSTDTNVTFTAEWHGLPSEVAVVVLYGLGEAIGWQRPVSGTAAFQLHSGPDQDPPDQATMVALTASGEEWRHYEVFPG